MSDEITSENQARPASKKRRVVAIYIDFVIFSALVALACWVLAKWDPSFRTAPLWLQAVVFVIVEVLLLRVVSKSPGLWALGIHEVGAPEPVVDPQIANRERWWTILLGVLVVLEGTKTAVRWSMWHPPVPFMGAQLEFASSALLSIVSGALLLSVGLLVLRCSARAAFIGAAFYGLALISAALSYDLWSSWAAADVVARREFQGLPVREGQVELMSRWAPMLAVSVPPLMVLWMLSAARRFSRTS